MASTYFRTLSQQEQASVPDTIPVVLSNAEYLAVMQQLVVIGPRNVRHDDARSAFRTLIAAAQAALSEEAAK